MKYMTFNSSCSYAGLANMLECYGIDTTDREIALEMGLPYLFAWEDGSYLSGPSLQSKKWFDLYLLPNGFALDEQIMPRANAVQYLKNQKCAMLGLRMDSGGKHAVVYTGLENERFRFLNNKWAQDPAPDILHFSKEELLERLDEQVAIAALTQVPAGASPIRERMEASIDVLHQYQNELHTVCNSVFPAPALRGMLNPMFRAILLDSITMLDLLGETQLHNRLISVQRSFLTALRSEAPEMRLADHIPTEALDDVIREYIALIQKRISE